MLVRLTGRARRARQGRAPDRAPGRRPRRDRGADARPRAAARASTRWSSATAREAAEPSASASAARAARPARPADVHDRPADGARTSTTRSPPRRSTTARCACGCTSPTSPRTCGRARRSTARRSGAATSVYVPGAVEPMLPEALSNRRLLARARARTGWRSRSSSSSTARRCAATAFHRSLIRSDERLDYPRVDRDLRRRASAPRSRGREPLAAARRGRRGAAGARASARRADGRVGRAGVRVLARRPRDRGRGRPSRPSRTALIEHLMIAANEAVATLLETPQAAGALPRARAARTRRASSGWSTQLDVARRADAAAARAR